MVLQVEARGLGSSGVAKRHLGAKTNFKIPWDQMPGTLP